MNPISIATRGYISPTEGTIIRDIQYFDNVEVLLMADLEVQLDSQEFTVTLEPEIEVVLEDNDFSIEVC